MEKPRRQSTTVGESDPVTERWRRVRANTALPVPLYHQVFSLLRDCILDGTFAPGDSFPSESEIQSKLQISRITARRALNEIAARGLITRQQGRTSSVAPYKPSTRLVAGVEGMIENSRRMGDETSVVLLEHEMVPASDEVSRKLKVRRGERVLWSVRVRSIDGVQFSYAVTYLPPFVAHQIDAEEMSARPLIDLLESAGIRIGRAEQKISAVAATAEVARALHIEPGSPLLFSERVVYDEADHPVELIAVQYRPDVYQYGVELRRTKSSNGNVWATSNVINSETKKRKRG